MGRGALTLTASDTYTGGTTISAGTLQIGSGGTSGSIVGNVLDNAALAFNRSDNPTFGGVISGVGNLIQAGTGTVTLTASNTYSGGTTIVAGALSLNNANAVQNSTVTVSANNGLRFNTNGGAIATFNAGGLSGSGAVNLADGSHAVALSVGSDGANTTYSGAIRGSGGLTKVGNGIVTLAGSNTYSGGTTISGGTLEFGAAASLPSGMPATVIGTLDLGAFDATVSALAGTGTVNDDGTGSNTLTVSNGSFSGTIENSVGTLALLKIGSGELLLSGSDDYSGGTIVDAGTLIATNAYALPAGTSLNVGAGGTFIFDPSVSAAPMASAAASQANPVPEPGTLVLLAAGAIGFLGYAWRRRRVTRTAKPLVLDQQDPPILSFPSHSSPAHAARRAA